MAATFKAITTLFIWLQLWRALATRVVAEPRLSSPHIVYIMADDMGWNDVSFHGSDQIYTPNLDTLAYQGVILQQYYSEAICTPARTALLTGKYPSRLGMHGNPLFNSENRGIPLTERLLPSYLKDLGYATHLVGKWHLGMSREEYLPRMRGYDSHYGMRGGYIDYYTYSKLETWPDGRQMFGLDFYDDCTPQFGEKRYIVDALTDRAVKIIEEHNASQPLFLHLTHNAPHSGNSGAPLQPPLYTPAGNNHIAQPNRRLYAEIVTHLDNAVGRVVRALANKHILDNTIIVFVSDNGAPTTGSLANSGINLPLRGIKYTPWEGAVRVPAFVWHSSFRPRVWNGLMHITDWLPTLVSAAGGNVGKEIDGINQWESIAFGGQSNRKEVLIILDNNSANRYIAYRAGDYKIILGNVTGVPNDYYGSNMLKNRCEPPDYFSILHSSDVAEVFASRGIYLDYEEVEAMRTAATIPQSDNSKNSTPCIPTDVRGCLYNVREDPEERHDLWNRGREIVSILSSRLRALWAIEKRRGPPDLQIEANPALYDYAWWPWIHDDKYLSENEFDDIYVEKTNSKDKLTNRHNIKTTDDISVVDCNVATGFRHFLCILRNIFQ